MAAVAAGELEAEQGDEPSLQAVVAAMALSGATYDEIRRRLRFERGLTDAEATLLVKIVTVGAYDPDADRRHGFLRFLRRS